MNAQEEIQARLKEPFHPTDIEWRIQSSGLKQNGEPWAKILAYVTNRAIMERLDKVFGVFGWQNEYKPAPQGGVLCGISVKDPTTGEWITKWDGAENTQVESVKGGLSASSKRSAVNFGIGRYLYELDEAWAVFDPKGIYNSKIKDKYVKWNPPPLPSWALPKRVGHSFLQEEFVKLMTATPPDERGQFEKQWLEAKTESEKREVLSLIKAFGGRNG